jgi:hypothetical protein
MRSLLPTVLLGYVTSTLACSGQSVKHDDDKRGGENGGESGSGQSTGGSEGGLGGSVERGGSDTGGRGGTNTGGRGGTDTGGTGGAAGDDSGGGGSGAAGGSDGGEGAMGTGGTGVPTCVPGASVACACADGRNGAQVCDDSGRFAPCVCTDGEFERVRALMVGSYRGTRTTPWDGTKNVTLDFLADETWRASCDDGCVVFYWGGDEDHPENGYRLTNVNDDGFAVGRLQLRWESSDSMQWGDLRRLGFNEDGNELKFEFWDTWGDGEHGPLEFDLERVVQ